MTNRSLPSLSWLDRLKQKTESTSPLEAEDSLVFRVLVQSLVIVGIIATDVAAQTYMSVWAIPLSIIGATWSWKRRRKRNITMKFILALGMLAMLFVFLGNLVENLNDTRLALASLLVQLQVLHSFDLPRRKDLGYSMMIGLILLGVAGTISQTMVFALWLLLFLAIAFPTLVLDYRSRLGLDPIDPSVQQFWTTSRPNRQQRRTNSPSYSPLSLRRLLLFLIITLALGLTVFAFIPRFPGYQLQNFPMSSPGNTQQRFDQENRQIGNPGYLKPGQTPKEEKGEGTSPLEGAGELDTTFYYGFNDKINQNLRGKMQPKVVLRVRSQASGFWRVLTFDHYTGQGWEMTGQDQLRYLSHHYASHRFYVSPVPTLAKTKQIVQTYTAVSYLPNVIPALPQPKFVFFPADQIGVDAEENLRAPLGLLEGLTYTVISDVPYRDRTALQKASTITEKGIKYPKFISKRYLDVPPEIEAEIRQKAEELLARSPKPFTSNYEKALFLAQQIKQNYQILPELPFFSEDDDLVEVFLFRYEGGYPDHFSTALTVMLRSLGIPARLAVGFAPGEFNPFTGYYIVRNTDAYALTEVYIPNYGWFSIDPIPGHELIPPSLEDDQTFSVLRQFWNWVAGWLPSPVRSFFDAIWRTVIDSLTRIVAWFWGLVSGSIFGFFVGLLLLVGLGFLSWLGWLQLQVLGVRRRLAKLPPMARLYQQMLAILGKQGYPKTPSQTPLEYVEAARQTHPPEASEIIEEISTAYVRWQYGEQAQNVDYLQQKLTQLSHYFRRVRS